MKPLFFLLAFVLCAEDTPKPEPQITAEQKLDYRRAQVEQLLAQAHMETAIAAMQKTCGERPVITDAKGDPTCGTKEPVK